MGAALYHGLIRRDGVFASMLPAASPPVDGDGEEVDADNAGRLSAAPQDD
jgi:cytochrome b561